MAADEYVKTAIKLGKTYDELPPRVKVLLSQPAWAAKCVLFLFACHSCCLLRARRTCQLGRRVSEWIAGAGRRAPQSKAGVAEGGRAGQSRVAGCVRASLLSPAGSAIMAALSYYRPFRSPVPAAAPSSPGRRSRRRAKRGKARWASRARVTPTGEQRSGCAVVCSTRRAGSTLD